MQDTKSQSQNRTIAWKILRARLYEQQKAKQEAERAEVRSSMIGSASRAIDGLPHEVLGISKYADKETVLNAYRELMKQYHPDKIGQPDTPQWKEAQNIAAAINQAKNTLMEKFKSSGN